MGRATRPVDAAPLLVIAVLDRADAHHEAAVRVLRSLIAGATDLLVSTANYAEVLVHPAQDDRTLRAAVTAIDALGVRLVPPTAPMARDAARLRVQAGVSLPDGFALATARAHGAAIGTFDRRVRRPLESAGVELAEGLADV